MSASMADVEAAASAGGRVRVSPIPGSLTGGAAVSLNRPTPL
jgi:hypothetical protein